LGCGLPWGAPTRSRGAFAPAECHNGGTVEIRHPLSAHDRATLTRWIETATRQVPQRLHVLTHKLEQLEHEQSELVQAFRQIPDPAVVSPLIDEFNQLAEEKGRLQEQRAQTRQAVRHEEIRRAECERQLKKVERELASSDRLDRRVAMAAKSQLVLDDYLEEMKTIKIEQLEHEVARFFNLLCHKQTLVREVRIDPQHSTVMLYGPNRTPIPTSELSAGEKQLYAMSLLWALRSVSGRAFPVIVDTPMGRLDSEHRHAILTRFFPQAAHQVVLLATDTEVDAAAFATLQPAMSHCYRLEFNQDLACTEVQRKEIVVPEGEEAVDVAA
jgi:DNA sulfur modification protein DndD